MYKYEKYDYLQTNTYRSISPHISNLRGNKLGRGVGVDGVCDVLGEDQETLVANIVSIMAHDMHLARVNVGNSLVRVWVAENDGGGDA